METVGSILKQILQEIYKGFFASLLIAVLFMFLYIGAKKFGWKEIAKEWINEFKKNSRFRKLFFLAFYSAMILFDSLLGRSFYSSPLNNVLGVWGLYDKNGRFNSDAIINIIFFAPFIILLFWTYRDKIFKSGKLNYWRVVGKAAVICFCISFGIEFSQLIFKLGTVQLSDLAFNSLGGVLGGTIYYLCYKLHNRAK